MSEYDWEKSAEYEPEPQADPIPNGTHDLEVKKVVFTKQDGTVFVSGKGAKQILVVYGDDQGREASEMFTLSPAAGWKLARMLKHAGANLSVMKSKGISPERFADPDFGNPQLVGRRFRAEVEWIKSEKDGKHYSNINPIGPAAPPAGGDIPI